MDGDIEEVQVSNDNDDDANSMDTRREEDGRKLFMPTDFPRKQEYSKDIAETPAFQNKCSGYDNWISTYLLLPSTLLLFVQVIIILCKYILCNSKLLLLKLLLNTIVNLTGCLV